MTVPSVPPPAAIRQPIDVALKAAWSYEPDTRTFTSGSGETFVLRGLVPKGTEIVHKVPRLARANPSGLTSAERDLRRYLQVILPRGESPEAWLSRVRNWPPVEVAHVGPYIGLPGPQ